MFRKVLIFAMFATAAGYCFAANGLPQVVTSEVFYSEDKMLERGGEYEDITQTQGEEYYEQAPAPVQTEVPAWPLAGSDADVEVACESGLCSKDKQEDNIRIVSKIGADLVVENNFNMGTRGEFGGWSGGANMLHGTQIPVGFDDECNNGSEMPLLHREVLEDDGGNILTVSRSNRKNCGGYADGYAAYAAKMGFVPTDTENGAAAAGAGASDAVEGEIAVDLSADAEPRSPCRTRFVHGWLPTARPCARFCRTGVTRRAGTWYGRPRVSIRLRPAPYLKDALLMWPVRWFVILVVQRRCRMQSFIKGTACW